MATRNDKLVLVCNECKRACCYYGYFMCDDARGASVVVMTVGELRKLDLEHPIYWTYKTFMEVYGTAKPAFSGEKRSDGAIHAETAGLSKAEAAA